VEFFFGAPEDYCDIACLLEKTGITVPNGNKEWTPEVATNSIVKQLISKIVDLKIEVVAQKKIVAKQTIQIAKLQQEYQESSNLTIYLQARVGIADGRIRWVQNYFDQKKFLWSDSVLVTCQVLAFVQAPVIGFVIFLYLDKVRQHPLLI